MKFADILAEKLSEQQVLSAIPSDSFFTNSAAENLFFGFDFELLKANTKKKTQDAYPRPQKKNQSNAFSGFEGKPQNPKSIEGENTFGRSMEFDDKACVPHKLQVEQLKASEYFSEQGLSLTPAFTLEELRRKFRKLCFQKHPDYGGTSEAFQTLRKNYSILKKFLNSISK